MVLSRIPPNRGTVILETRDTLGHLVDRQAFHNAYTDVGATDHAKQLAGELNAPSPVLSHIGLGWGGPMIADCESQAGWSSDGIAPVVDYAIVRQGLASLRLDVPQASSHYMYRASACTPASAVGGSIEAAIRLDLRGRCDLAQSGLWVYAGDGSKRFDVSLATIETLSGTPFQDGVWKAARIPLSAFSVGAGSPSWSGVTGCGLHAVANGSGALSAHLDDVRIYPAAIDTSSAALVVPSEFSRKPLADLYRSASQVVATAFWPDGEAVGQLHALGLYANGGQSLVAIASKSYYKQAGLTLTVTWVLETRGG